MAIFRTVFIGLTILPQCLHALQCDRVSLRVSGRGFSHEPAQEPEPYSGVVSATKIADPDVSSANIANSLVTPSTESCDSTIDAHGALSDAAFDLAVFEVINGKVEGGREARLLKQIAELSKQVKASKIRAEEQVKASRMKAEALQGALLMSQARERKLTRQLGILRTRD